MDVNSPELIKELKFKFFGNLPAVNMSEMFKARMMGLSRLPGNNKCADCSDSDPTPDFISLKLGVFVCIKCSGIHRSLGPNCSNIKSIKLDTMTEELCDEMEKQGNLIAKQKFQYNVPECWPTIKKNDFPDLIEQWIRAKYERREFVEGDCDKKTPYANGSKYGWLFKKVKDGNKWNKRYFVLSSQQGYLCYFLKQEGYDIKCP